MEIVPIRVLRPVWIRGSARVEGGEIVLDEDRAEEFGFEAPEDSERMAFELASLPWHRKDEREVVRFVRRYGLLWHGADDLGSGKCRESLEDWSREAALLAFVGAFYQHLMDSKRDGSATKVQDFLRQVGYGFRSLSPDSEDFDELYIRGASKMLQDLVNEGLNAGPNDDPQARRGGRRSWWGLAAVGPGEFRLAQYPPDLLSRAYSALAVLIAGQVETRFCPVCGKQFRPKPRQGPACEDHASTYRSQRRREKLKRRAET